MDSPQSIVSPFKNSMVTEQAKQKSDFFSRESEVNRKTGMSSMENFIGVLEVYVHQARDIHNICIYHKQDVYAKLCLTSDPETSVSTNTINGGGQNPVFNENLSLNVRTVDTSLKCEIFMMSRVKNYLEDQLLGFALVPLSEVLLKNGKLDKEFSLSSTDLFHSPAGFVRLSLAYTGSTPDVMAFPAIPSALAAGDVRYAEIMESLSSELDKIEFPDPQVANENQMMVSEYIEISCTNVNPESKSFESLVASASGNQGSIEGDTHATESFSTAAVNSIQASKFDSPPSSVSTNGVFSPQAAASSESSDTPLASKTSTPKHHVAASNDKHKDVGDTETDSSRAISDMITKPVVSVNIEPEQKVVQQDIVDMYMKSMQQFTESLAKMKLPNFDTEPTNSGNSSSDQSLQAPKTPGSRVFYGSRAFF